MRRSAMIPGNPWTLLITLEEDPDTLGCWVRVQELTMDGATADYWELHFSYLDEALREMEMAYGIGPDDWTDLS
jgi:hypothetical protein